MASIIPACGIKAYMEGQIAEQAPPDFFWKLRYHLDRKFNYIFPLFAIVLALLFQTWPEFGKATLALPTPDNSLWSYGRSTAFGFVSAMGISMILSAILPMGKIGVWKRYPVKDHFKKWSTFPVADGDHEKLLQLRYIRTANVRIEEEIYRTRKFNNAAEFEVAVLELKGITKPFGMVLFQTTVQLHEFNSEDEPLIIISPEGQPVQFGEAYVPPRFAF